MRPQHAREASQSAQTEREREREEGCGEGETCCNTQCVGWKSACRMERNERPSTVDNVIKFSAYLFATNKIKTIVKMREKDRRREGEREGSSMWHSLAETGTGRGCWVRALPTNT